MATSSTQIANFAIGHIGIAKQIANLESDTSREALACRLFYTTALEKVLGDFNWPFATKFISLGLVEENPIREWAYSYRYPSDCLNLRRILSGVRNDNRQSIIPFRVGQDDTGALIYTDAEDAEMEYTVRVTDTARFSPNFSIALSYLLASYIVPMIVGSDRFKMIPGLLQLYDAELRNAQAGALNEQQDEQLPESEFIRARDGINSFDTSTSFRSF